MNSYLGFDWSQGKYDLYFPRLCSVIKALRVITLHKKLQRELSSLGDRVVTLYVFI
jgi:hypothetical protein